MNKQNVVLGVALSLVLLLNVGATVYNTLLMEQLTVNQAALAEGLESLSYTNEQVASELGALTKYLTYLSGQLLTKTNAKGEFSLQIHVTTVHRRDGKIIGFSENAGVLTTIGLDYIQGLLGNNATTASAQWISLSNDAGPPSAAWTIIPNEIAANNLTRAQGVYADGAGNGVWTSTYMFTASGNQAVQLVGVNWAPSGDNNLMWADLIAAANLIANDTLEITCTTTVTG